MSPLSRTLDARRRFGRLALGVLAVLALLAGAGPAGAESDEPRRVVAIVKVPTPWYAPRFFVRWRFEAAIPRYAEIPGLERKFFTIADTGELGGIYLWQDREAADAFFDAAWHRDIETRYGAPASLRVWDSPMQGVGARPSPAAARQEVGTSYVAVWVGTPGASGLAARSARIGSIGPSLDTDGLLHRYDLRVSEGEAFVSLWNDRALAEAFFSEAWRSAASKRAGAPLEIEFFEAPVLLNVRPAAR